MQNITVPGLNYVPNYIDAQEQNRLLKIIDQQPWLTDLKRRVQHYGYRYDYKTRSIDPTMFLGALPDWILPCVNRLHADGFMEQVADQAIINEYQPGQGISSHIDCEPCFGNIIVSLTLGSTCVMVYSKGSAKLELLLEPGSIVVMRDEARHAWKHAIPARKSDTLNGVLYERTRRVSLTFRNIIK